MSYKKKASSNRDALFGAPAGGPKHKRDAASNRNDLFAGASDGKKSSSSSSHAGGSSSSRPTSTAPRASAPSPTTATKSYSRQQKKKTSKPGSNLSAEARAEKLKQAEEFKQKANKCMQKSFFNKPDPVAASTYYKRAADCYQQVGDVRLERLYRLESGNCNMQVGAWASAASDYTRAAELILDDNTVDMATKRRDGADYHKKAAAAWTQMNEKAKAAGSQVKAAIALNYGDEGRLLSKQALAGMEEAVEAHVPDVLNPYARYRQTGVSAFIDPDSEETVQTPSAETLEFARTHLVSRAYAHEPLQELVHLLVGYGEYATALYAAGAARTILEQDGLSTLSLSRAYVVETILTLAMGDPIAAEQNFLNTHVQKTFYLSSRECKLAEDLFRAVKMRDIDALEEARSPSGSNRGALANLHESLRMLVAELRISGVARKTVGETATTKKTTTSRKEKDEKQPRKKPAAASKPVPPAPSPMLTEPTMDEKTGYEQEEPAAAKDKELNADALQAELDDLDFGGGLESDSSEDIGDGLEDDDIDLR